MDTDTLTLGQFSVLQDIGECAQPMSSPLLFACLGVLLRMDYIRAERDGYVLTMSGSFRVAGGY
jgi:hypothetical protein